MPFSKKTIDFLIENRLNDSKVWYQEHKEDYKKYVAEPFSEFITSATIDKTPAMYAITGRAFFDTVEIKITSIRTYEKISFR